MKRLMKCISLILIFGLMLSLFGCASTPTPEVAPPANTNTETAPVEQAPAPEKPATEEAKKLELTVYFGSPEDEMMPVLNAFKAKYPNVDLKTYRAPSEELIATMQMELAANNPQFDVAIVANTSIKTLEKDYDAFAPFVPTEVDALPAGLLDPNNIEIPVGQNFYVI